MTIKGNSGENEAASQRYPRPDPGVRFLPADFFEVIAQIPAGCPLVGGQAVAWWALRYGIQFGSGNKAEPVTSADIDFWGSRGDLKAIAKSLNARPVFPHDYEMTVWVGAIQLNVGGKKTVAEFLHTVPGLDTNDPDVASVEQEFRHKSVRKVIQVLSPISLVLAKLHALRHYDQKHRQDELHLKVCLQTTRNFIAELLENREVRQVLWNCERLIAVHQTKPVRKLEAKHQFEVLKAIPIEAIGLAANDQRLPLPDQERLANFVNLRWKRLTGS